MATGTITVTLQHPGRIVGADKAIATVIVNGQALEEMKLGETVSMDVPAGTASVSLVTVMGPMTRQSKAIGVTVRDGETTQVTGKYSRLWGKYKLTAS